VKSKVLQFAIVFCLACPVRAAAQQVSPYHDEIQNTLRLMTSTDWQVRRAAFYRLLELGLHDNPRGKAYLFPSALKTLTELSPQDASQVEAGLISLLQQENAAVRTFEHSNGTMSEEQSDYYGDVIAAVTGLKTPSSIDALLGAVNTGGMATRTLAAFGRSALGPLLSTLDDPDPSKRSGVVTTLSEMMADGNREKLDPASRLEVERALLKASADKEVGVRLSAVDGLAYFPDESARSALKKLATSDPTVFPGEGEGGTDLYPVRNAAKRALAKTRLIQEPESQQ
jgi:HEAT repeat protein